jgi:hypothetical protein
MSPLRVNSGTIKQKDRPKAATDKSAISPAAITDAHAQPIEIIGNPEREVIPANPKTNA